MLCRAVLAVLAVTCTFPLALAIAQGTEPVQLKDLVCVLWFSGLKKEDMDVNLLTKLRRHKINIDMKNETMQHECSISKLALTGQDKKPARTTISTTLPTNTDISNLSNSMLNDGHLDPIVKFMNDIQKTKRNFVNDNHEEAPTLPKVHRVLTNVFETSYSTRDMPSERSFIKKSEPAPENVESKLESILSFWQAMAKTSEKRIQQISEETTKITSEHIKMTPTYKQQIRLPKSVTTPPYSFSFTTKAPVIERWLADFIEKNMNRWPNPTTTQRTIIPHDLEELILPFYKDLIHTYDSRPILQDTDDGEVNNNLFKFTLKNDGPHTFDTNKSPSTRLGTVGDISINNEPIKYDMLLKKSNRENIAKLIKNNISNNKDENQKLPNEALQEIADSVKAMILKDLGAFVNISTIPVPPAASTVTLPPPASTTVTLPSPTSTTVTLPPPDPTTITLPQPAPAISTETISNDLIITTTVKPQNWTGNVYQVMDKIIDLYERVKAISERINKSRDAAIIPAKQNNERSRTLKKEMFTENVHQDVFNTMSNVKHIIINPFRDMTRQELQKLPSIIQTNSGEIAPLLIPMENPMKIINQILVVTTAKPKMIGMNGRTKSRYEKFIESYKNRGHASLERNRSQKTTIPNSFDYKKYSHFSNFDVNHSLKDIPNKYITNHGDTFERPHNYISRYTEGSNKNLKHYSKDNDKENREHINYFDYISGSHLEKIPTNRHSEKFHEKLENEDGRLGGDQQSLGNNKVLYGQKKELFRQNKELLGQSKELFSRNKELFGQNKDSIGQTKDIIGHIKDMLSGGRESAMTYDSPVASRQQQPLNAQKSPYDDTHFRNFLKTQQQVNDMLEKILASKNTLPFSVETT